VADEQRSLAISQVVVPGVALVIAGPAFAVRFASNPLYVALGIIAAVVGIALLVYSYFRFRSRK
jgi:hypothetical protein